MYRSPRPRIESPPWPEDEDTRFCVGAKFIAAAVIVLVVLLLAAATPHPWSSAPVADAAQRGELTELRTLLRQGEDVNAAQGDGMTGLHWAAYRGDTEMVGVLVYAGANLEATTRIGEYTPLLIAARTGHGAAVEALLEAGAKATARTSTGVTALHFAAGTGQAAAIEALLRGGAAIDAREDARGQTPLIFAGARGRLEAIQTLIAAGAEIDAVTRVVEVPVLEQQDRIDARMREERLEAMATLRTAEQEALAEMRKLAAGPDESAPIGEAEDTAAAAVEPEAAEEAAEAPEEPAEDEEEKAVEPDRDVAAAAGETPAAEAPEEPLSYGELVGGTGGMSALHHAAREGHREVALALLEAGADPNLRAGGDLSTPMLLATINGHFDLALQLMTHGADPELGNHADVTPLWAAINVQWAPKALYPQPKAHQRQEVDYLTFMERLLEAGVDPDVRTNRHVWFMSYNFDLLGVNIRGSTPFWRAAYAVDVPAMQLLVAWGADPGIPTRKPPERRRRGGDDDEEEEDPSGLPPIPVGGPGVFPIHAASGAGYGQDFAANSHEHAPDGWLPAVRYLVEELGADVNARDQFGYTPVHHAAARGDEALIEYLVSKGADVTLVARTGQTTVDMANGPIQRVEPYPTTIALLEGLGAKNNHKCLSCE